MGYKRTTNGDIKPCELGNIHLQNLACHKKRGLGGSSKETGSPGEVLSGTQSHCKWVIITKSQAVSDVWNWDDPSFGHRRNLRSCPQAADISAINPTVQLSFHLLSKGETWGAF